VKVLRIGIVSDHAGFAEKAKIMLILQKLIQGREELRGVEFEDYGPHTLNPLDDYPDFSRLLAANILKGRCFKGIAVCGTGIGMSMDLNKVPGIRAALCYSEEAAQKAASHNNANVICLRGDLNERQAEQIIFTWLATPFDISGEKIRHVRRLKKMERGEGQYLGRRFLIRIKSLFQ
jgi:ribose 5-phosphate isomerase B